MPLCWWLHSGQKRSYEPGNLHCTGHTVLNAAVYIFCNHLRTFCILLRALTCQLLSMYFSFTIVFPSIRRQLILFFLISAHLQRKHNTISSVHFALPCKHCAPCLSPPLSHYFAKNSEEHLTCYKVLSLYNRFPRKSRWHLGAALWQFRHGRTTVSGFPVCPQVLPVYHCTQCLLRNALFSDTAIPSAADLSRVLFQRHDVSCDLKWPGNRSLLLNAQGLLLTNGVTNTSWWSHSKFFLSKSNKQTMCNRGPHSVSPHFLDFLRPAKRANPILCSSHPWAVLLWTMEGFFYLIGSEKMVRFFPG